MPNCTTFLDTIDLALQLLSDLTPEQYTPSIRLTHAIVKCIISGQLEIEALRLLAHLPATEENSARVYHH